MEKQIEKLVADKTVGILGFGREGRSTYNLLKKVGGCKGIIIADAKDIADKDSFEADFIIGDDYLNVCNVADVIFKSPGVVLDKEITSYKGEITSQTEQFIKAYRNQVIGITGTKGKSTTSSLLYHVLKESGKNVLFAGNIGLPMFEIVQEVTSDTIIVLELSCHQLEFTKVSPHKGILLNIYEDHLDHYGTREKYAEAKKQLFYHMQAGDTLYCNEECKPLAGETKADVLNIKMEMLPFSDFENVDTRLKGRHNLFNAAFVYRASKDLGVSDEDFIKALATFEPLKHRLEFVGRFDGIDYYDDSISTTVKSAISAVESINNAGVLLLGGMERGIDYTELIDYLSTSKLDTVVCMYSSGARIMELASKVNMKPQFVYKDDLKLAMKWVKENAKKDKACILSPASASYGYFKNFEERGDVFASLARV